MIRTDDHPIKAVLFDFDGTLTIPGELDFAAIRIELGCPPDQPIIEFVQATQDPHGRKARMDRLTAIESLAAGRSRPNTGAQELIQWLKSQHWALGILTRNSRQSVLRALENFDALEALDFDLIITRDDPLYPKPSGEGILWAAQMLGLRAEQILMVGDFIFDCQAGRVAGAPTVLLDPFGDPRLQSVDCDYRIGRLIEVKDVLLSIGPEAE
ncbi:MAG: HAD family hydrolase [Desulfobacteraceae bacterium]|nr:MAG: HAD family hydrolase [Desulfobacteraceae bacterium]